MSTHERVRSMIEWLLPWYSRGREKARDARTEMIRQRSIRLRRDVAEPILEQYRRTDLLRRRR